MSRFLAFQNPSLRTLATTLQGVCRQGARKRRRTIESRRIHEEKPRGASDETTYKQRSRARHQPSGAGASGSSPTCALSTGPPPTKPLSLALSFIFLCERTCTPVRAATSFIEAPKSRRAITWALVAAS
ncbi:hypothetical protein K505DRAFT_159990 [Melanomma pulvis-pyrius CBS 109.77]|uniref:Uncharacterized protein n=1 Tax=Melanomma pulvis-pyrius CBS 109.77 TaxID=1314802 RepID=A0A6A6XJA3_9PLEO|nr:hypothetical protein K505DRAFT_159990 [Melanomma pulvis-pyrius CBS 109.77]